MKAFKFFSVLTVCALIAIALLSGARQSQAAAVEIPAMPEQLPTDQLIIKYLDSTNINLAGPDQASEMARLSSAAGVELAYFRPMSGDAHVLKLPVALPEGDVAIIAAKLTALPDVVYAEPDAIVLPMATTPNDPEFSNQWHYAAPAGSNYGINAPVAWDITKGSSTTVVAVLDTGITDHPDLSGRWVSGYDFISDTFMANDGGGRDSDAHDPGDWVAANECYAGSSARDSSWHGTHVAGTIGAATNNGVGVAGVDWNARILPVRVLGKCGGMTSDIADGMRWAAGLAVSGVPNNPNPAKVINMSLGGYGACTTTYQNAIDAIVTAGTTLVISAGNSNDDSSLYRPGNCNNVITVAATDRTGGRAYYSNYGSVVEISGPGGAQSYANDPDGVLSTLNSGATVPSTHVYRYYQGTSMSAPHVAGVASLLYSLSPSLTPAQAVSILQNTVTAFPGGSSCTTSICGTGIVNAGNAVSILPRLTDVSPPEIELGVGATVITVTGANFNATSVIYWKGQVRTTTFVSSTQLIANLTAADTNQAGFAAVTVRGTYVPYGTIATAAKNVVVGADAIQDVFLPLIIKSDPPTPTPTPTLPPNNMPVAGLWTASGNEFYVMTNQAYVDNFAVYFSVSGCGSYKVTHLNPEEPINNNQFSFSGSFYGSGTFNTTTTATGQSGLSNFILYGCGTVNGGPWSYSASWKNTNQPAPDFFEAILVKPDATTIGEYAPNVIVEYLGP